METIYLPIQVLTKIVSGMVGNPEGLFIVALFGLAGLAFLIKAKNNA